MKLVEVSKLKIDLIDFLLQKGFDINFENDDRLTPLHYILQYWNYPEGRVTSLYDKTKILLDKGAKIDSESSVGSDVSNTILSNIDRTRTSFFEHRTNSNMFIKN